MSEQDLVQGQQMLTPRDEEAEDYTLPVVLFFGGSLPLIGVTQFLGCGMPGFVAGAVGAGVLAFTGRDILEKVRRHMPGLDRELDRYKKIKWSALLGPLSEGIIEAEEDENIVEADITPSRDEQQDAPATDNDLFAPSVVSSEVPGVRRLSIDELVAHTKRNSYEVYLGRSLTRPGNPAVKINFYKRHIKLIGASQHGKSSMAAALIDQITRTHDQQHVLLALLDLEHKTSRLFADVPHIAELTVGDKTIDLHAKSYEEVLERLELICSMIDYRYTLSEQELDQLPILIVYLEEFIDLKDYFKQLIDAVPEDQREQAKRKYTRLVYCIKKIAARGLKVYVQYLMCAQVDYADEDLKEALVNITSGMTFCVRPTAAKAAGFYQTELIARNAKEDKAGQCVVEMPDCKDLILAPDYDLKARLRALRNIPSSPASSVIELKRSPENAREENTENSVNVLEKPVNTSENEREYSHSPENVLPSYTQAEETRVILAYGELLASSGGKQPTRTALRDYLRWDNKMYTRVIKPVCDKHSIG